MLHVFDIGDRQPIRLLPFLDVVMSWNRGDLLQPVLRTE